MRKSHVFSAAILHRAHGGRVWSLPEWHSRGAAVQLLMQRNQIEVGGFLYTVLWLLLATPRSRILEFPALGKSYSKDCLPA